jgi:nitroreductase
MNAVIELLKSHRSIRKFTDQAIEQDMLLDILQAGQSAATSSFIQATTVIRVNDPQSREKLVEYSGGQGYVGTAPEFLVFCADMARAEKCCELNGVEAQKGFTEHFIIATVDVALMAQNVVIAAESLGLGICYIGGLRNKPQEVSDLLALPDHVYPVFGLCLGYPDQSIDIRPRLPISIILKQEKYNTEGDEKIISNYDKQVESYYAKRLGANKSMTWTKQVAGLASKEARPHMLEFLKGKSFLKK